MSGRLIKQMAFIREIDQLKNVYRQSYLMDGSRHENDAEHTWHITMMAVILEEHLQNDHVDLFRVIKMLLIHDLVEIDAGDTFAYDTAGYVGKFDREKLAAERLFGLLPDDQFEELLALWMEFEEGQTAEAQYALAMDRLQPLMHNYYTEGKAWQQHKVTSDRVLARIAGMKETVPALYDFARELIEDAVAKGYLLAAEDVKMV